MLPYVNFVIYMRYKENKSPARLKIYFSSNFKRAFKSYSNKTSKSRPASRYIVWFTSVERTIHDIIYGETGEYAKRITQRGANHRCEGEGDIKNVRESRAISIGHGRMAIAPARRFHTVIGFDRYCMCVCVCVYVYVRVCICVLCICVCVQIRNMCSRREQRQTALFRRFSAHFALRWKGSRAVHFFLFFYFAVRLFSSLDYNACIMRG